MRHWVVWFGLASCQTCVPLMVVSSMVCVRSVQLVDSFALAARCSMLDRLNFTKPGVLIHYTHGHIVSSTLVYISALKKIFVHPKLQSNFFTVYFSLYGTKSPIAQYRPAPNPYDFIVQYVWKLGFQGIYPKIPESLIFFTLKMFGQVLFTTYSLNFS